MTQGLTHARRKYLSPLGIWQDDWLHKKIAWPVLYETWFQFWKIHMLKICCISLLSRKASTIGNLGIQATFIRKITFIPIIWRIIYSTLCTPKLWIIPTLVPISANFRLNIFMTHLFTAKKRPYHNYERLLVLLIQTSYSCCLSS